MKESLIEGIQNILEKYIWSLNTEENRELIKKDINKYLENYGR